jgi:hypothetical protein
MAREKAEKRFEEEGGKVVLEGSGWEKGEQEAQLREDMDAVAELLRKEETRKMVAVIEVRFFSCSLSYTNLLPSDYLNKCGGRNCNRSEADAFPLSTLPLPSSPFLSLPYTSKTAQHQAPND